MPTTAGSLALAGSSPTDAFLVRRLKAAGPLILGKANLSEWANYRSTQSSSGWSGVGGQTNNPYVLDRNPCGSSSGSAVAAAADLATVADRHRDRRLDRVPVRPERRRRHQADARPGQPRGHRADLGRAGHRRPDHAQRHRRRRRARRDHRRRPARPGDRRAARARPRRLHAATCGRSRCKGARIGVWREGNFGAQPGDRQGDDSTIARLKALGATSSTRPTSRSTRRTTRRTPRWSTSSSTTSRSTCRPHGAEVSEDPRRT